MVYVRGLSPQSATWLHLAASGEMGAEPDGEIGDEQAAENALARLFRRPAVRIH